MGTPVRSLYMMLNRNSLPLNTMKLSVYDSNVFKGIAILIMLFHHLFLRPEMYGYDDIFIHGHGLIFSIAKMCKVCVAIFVFISGYGLTEKYGSLSNIKLKDFYWKRFVKLMLNYWFVWLIFVPVSVLWLGPSFAEVYGSDYLIHGRVILDFLGIVNWLGPTVYNYIGAWWFYGCIIGLYLLYPLLLKLMKQNEYYLLALAITIFCLPSDILFCIRIYLPVFVCGMLYSFHDNDRSKCIAPPIAIWVVTFFFILIGRHKPQGNDFYVYDALIMVTGAYIYQHISGFGKVKNVLAYFGKYSMDMFLIHGFFYKWWLHDIIYATKIPFIIYISLVAISLIVAIAIEKTKQVIGFNHLVKYLRSL